MNTDGLLKKQGSIKTKISLLVTIAVVLIVTILGFYFDSFLKASSLDDARIRMRHGYERLTYNLKSIERELKDSVAFVNSNENMIASVELINNYQNKNNYNTYLIDEEKKSIAIQLLNRVKLSSSNDVALYDINNELIAFVNKKEGNYLLNYISYENKQPRLYGRNENQSEYSSGSLKFPNNIAGLHKTYYNLNQLNHYGFVSYHNYNDQFVIKLHQHIYEQGSDKIIGHIEISRILDSTYFEKLSNTLDLDIKLSFDSSLDAEAVVLQNDFISQQLNIIQSDLDYTAIFKQGSQDGAIYYVIYLNKIILNALLNENRKKLVILLLIVALVIMILMRTVIHRWLDKPLSELMLQIHKIESQDYSASKPVSTGDELETISVNINRLAHTVKERETSLGISRDELEHLSNHDELTNLPNRRVFSLSLQHALNIASRSDGRIAIFFLDIDQFKMINDTLGHDVGDQLLIQVSKRLFKNIRAGDTLARIGGDEFNILIENAPKKENLEKIIENYMSLFDKPFQCNEHIINVTISVGIAIYPEHGKDSVTLIKNSDLAMYNSKDNGRNKYTFFSEDLSVVANQRVELIHALDNAIESGEQFKLHYQPKVSAGSHEIVSIEALIRWERPNHGNIPPDKFIKLTEETGQIIPIGKWVIEQACQDFIHLCDEGICLEHVSINISNVQLSQSDLLSVVQETIIQTGIKPEQIELEITESYIATDVDDAISTLQTFHNMGVGIAVDDFGTGYSSMNYLHKLPLSRLKIDKSFVDGLPESKDSSTITRAIISLAKSFELAITAEGVEEKEQLLFLECEQCDEIQGYYFSEPLCLNDFKMFYLSKVGEGNNMVADNIRQISAYLDKDV